MKFPFFPTNERGRRVAFSTTLLLAFVFLLSGCGLFQGSSAPHPVGNGEGYDGLTSKDYYLLDPTYTCTLNSGTTISSYRDDIRVKFSLGIVKSAESKGDLCHPHVIAIPVASLQFPDANHVIYQGQSYQYSNTAGSSDFSFGSAGLVMNALDGTTGQDIVNQVLAQSDGKIVALGQSGLISTTFTMVRYLANGQADTSFGRNGLVTTSPWSSSAVAGTAQAFAGLIQPDTKIVLAGTSTGTSPVIAMARYLSDGSADLSFANNGLFQMNNVGGAATLARQNDGMLVSAWMSSGPGISVLRLRTDGSPDPSFGVGGIVSFSPAPGSGLVTSLKIQNDGKFLITSNGAGISQGYLVRLQSNGAADPTFGNLGVTLAGVPSTFNAMELQPDGKIIAVGKIAGQNPGGNFSVFRFWANGTLDTTFGTNGITEISFQPFGGGAVNGVAKSVTLLANGQIVAAGMILATGTSFVAARLNPDGSLDTTFASDSAVPGVKVIPFTGTTAQDYSQANSVVQTPDGALILGGPAATTPCTLGCVYETGFGLARLFP